MLFWFRWFLCELQPKAKIQFHEWNAVSLNREFQRWVHRLKKWLMFIPYRNQTTNNYIIYVFVGHGSIVPQDPVVFQWFSFNQWFKRRYFWCFISRGNAYERDSCLKICLWFTPLKLKMVYLKKTPLHHSKEMNHLWDSILESWFQVPFYKYFGRPSVHEPPGYHKNQCEGWGTIILAYDSPNFGLSFGICFKNSLEFPMPWQIPMGRKGIPSLKQT